MYKKEISGDYQCGFRRQESTENLFKLSLVPEKAEDFGTEFWLSFKEAYGTV
jgi:hypothetical protein